MSDMRLISPEAKRTKVDDVAGNSTQASDRLREAAISIADSNITLAKKHSELLAQKPLPEVEDNSTISRLLFSAAAGVGTRMGIFMSQLHTIPKVGCALTVVTPFVASGLTSSYMKTGELTDLRSAAEGVASYGLLGQGFTNVRRDIIAFAEVPLMRQLGYTNEIRLGTQSIELLTGDGKGVYAAITETALPIHRQSIVTAERLAKPYSTNKAISNGTAEGATAHTTLRGAVKKMLDRHP
ncbi:MAG: hypothetical protein K2W95_09235 [Candidatus Obscuribacterales bacterium]|nr:hypothetical protein [Candidatus Obscuribacterales bacterium]